MSIFRKSMSILGVAVIAGVVGGILGAGNAYAQAANPCAPKAASPCAPKAANPCAAKFEVDAKLVVRPKGTSLAKGGQAELAKAGEKLFKDPKLSTNGMSCNSCHEGNAAYMPSFAQPYPHEVAMAKEKGGVAKVQLDEMVQFCMVVPMAAKPLPWNSRDLAALTAYTGEMQKEFRKQTAQSATPCAPKAANPCAPKAANPCAVKPANPCAPKK